MGQVLSSEFFRKINSNDQSGVALFGAKNGNEIKKRQSSRHKFAPRAGLA